MPQAVSQTAPPWWKGAVIYQIYPRSFLDTDGDGVGDLAGITARLDHVASLGVDAVWLSPFFVSPMKDYGYDVADYTDVDPLFGTLADFDALIARAHGPGLRVIVDMVFAHTSDQHCWFASSRDVPEGPHADWYVWADPKPDGAPPNNWQSVFGGPAWRWNAARNQYSPSVPQRRTGRLPPVPPSGRRGRRERKMLSVYGGKLDTHDRSVRCFHIVAFRHDRSACIRP